MTDVLGTLLSLLLLLAVVLAARGIWRLFTGGSPAGGGGSHSANRVTPVAPLPWTPYQEPGAPIDPGDGFVTGLVVGHWLGEHHQHDRELASGSGDAGHDGYLGDDDLDDDFSDDY